MNEQRHSFLLRCSTLAAGTFMPRFPSAAQQSGRISDQLYRATAIREHAGWQLSDYDFDERCFHRR